MIFQNGIYFYDVLVDDVRKVHKSLKDVEIATESGVQDYIPKSFNNVKVYSGVNYQNYNPADVEIKNFLACQGFRISEKYIIFDILLLMCAV